MLAFVDLTYPHASYVPPDVPSREFVCDHCHKGVHWHALVLMRDRFALPDEPTYFLHENCIRDFTRGETANWVRIPKNSPEAGWLLPGLNRI